MVRHELENTIVVVVPLLDTCMKCNGKIHVDKKCEAGAVWKGWNTAAD